MGTLNPFGYAKLSAVDLSDAAFVPAQLNWSLGNFSFKLAEVTIAPTGGYNDNDVVNLRCNYWSFDTVGAVTWLDPSLGSEISLAPSIMYNTEINATDYQTGAEFHLDFTAKHFLTETLSVGLRGYWYRQLTADSGDGAVLGSFRSESFGLEPGFLWTPKFANGRLSLLGKWMHDFEAENRFKSDYFTLTGAWKF